MTSIGFWGPLTQWVDEPTRDFPQMVGPNRWLPGPVAIQECHAYQSKPQGDPSRACTSKLFMFPGMHAFVHVCMYVFSWCEHTHSTIDTYTKSHAYIVVAYTYIEIYIYYMYVHIICMYMYVRIICYVQFSNLTLNFCALGLCRRLGDFATKLRVSPNFVPMVLHGEKDWLVVFRDS